MRIREIKTYWFAIAFAAVLVNGCGISVPAIVQPTYGQTFEAATPVIDVYLEGNNHDGYTIEFLGVEKLGGSLVCPTATNTPGRCSRAGFGGGIPGGGGGGGVVGGCGPNGCEIIVIAYRSDDTERRNVSFSMFYVR